MNLGGILVGGLLVALWGLVIGASIYLEFAPDEDLRKEGQKEDLR